MLKNKSILKLFAVLTVMIISMSMLTGCGNGKNGKDKVEDYEEPVKNLVEGLGEANAEKFLNAFPPFISDYMKNVFSDEYLGEILKQAEEEYGANVKMSYKVTNKADISEEDIKSAQEDLKTNFDREDTITKGYKLDVEITTKGDDSEDVDTDSFEVYEIDGKWYIIDL